MAEDFITGGQDTVGLRVPSDPIALALIQEFEKISNSAIAAPSANRFGQVSPTCSDDVREELSAHLMPYDQILDGGSSTIGIESTIIDCTKSQPKILRPGFITKEQVERISRVTCNSEFHSNEIKVSGSFEKHYAPNCKVLIGAQSVVGSGFLALKDIETPEGMFRIGSPCSVEEFARVLYSSLRSADHKKLKSLVVIPPEGVGLSMAITERLIKSSHGR